MNNLVKIITYERIKPLIHNLVDEFVHCGRFNFGYDIFDLSQKYSNKFDFIFEYTCYCAIDPVRREEYFDLVYNLLKPNGILFGIFLPLDKEEVDGPPFSVSIDEILKHTSGRFKVQKNYFSSKSIEPRKGSEKVLIFEKI